MNYFFCSNKTFQLNIDCSLYGKATLQELISLVPEVHMRKKGGEWIIHLAQQEQGKGGSRVSKHQIKAK